MVRSLSLVRRLTLALALVASALTVGLIPAAQAAGPETWFVATSGTPSGGAGGTCSNPGFAGSTHVPIQAAINAATDGDTIRICPGTYSVGATIDVTKSLTFTGDAVHLSILDGGGTTRVMNISVAGSTVAISNLQFRNGRTTGEFDNGAGIQVHTDAILTVTESLFVANHARHHGGAIALFGGGSGTLSVTRSTFYKNRAIDGGAIAIGGNTADVSTSTFVENHASRQGGALNGSFANLNAHNSTIIDNTAGADGAATWVVSLTGSLIAYTNASAPGTTVCDNNAANPIDNVSTSADCLSGGASPVTSASLQLGILAPWGGPTPTYSIGAGSSAIGTIPQAYCPATDQRGTSRGGGNCDAGAFEYQDSPATLTASGPITLIAGNPITPEVTFSRSGLTEPVSYRVASEVSASLPGGVTFNASNGAISGIPISTTRAVALIITATGSNGAASARLVVDNCTLTNNAGVFEINNAVDLGVFEAGACGMDADYELTADIAWNRPWSSNTSANEPFTGTFDGDGHSISGLQISGGSTAFLAVTDGATIRNLIFSADVNGATAANGEYGSAGLIHAALDTIVDDVHGSGTITIPNDVGGCHGGLIGDTYNGSIITDSSFTGEVDAPTSSWNGGLIGCVSGGTVVERSFFDGDVNGFDEIGGLIGWMDNSDLRDSYSIGTVTGHNNKSGGLVGWLGGDSGDADLFAVQNSYASMAIAGVTAIGALVGEGGSTSIDNSYWEAGLAGVDGLDPIGGLSDQGGTQPNITATSTTDMKSFDFFDSAGWAIVDGWEGPTTTQNVWGICDGESRPFLLSHHATDPCVAPQQPSPQPNPAPFTPSTPTPPTTPTTPVVNPSTPPTMSTGGSLAYVGGRVVEPSMSWSNDNTIRGTIGPVDFALTLGTPQLNTPRTLSVIPGSTLAIDLTGLKPNTLTTATLFSTPTSLGEVKVDATGRLGGSFTIPRNIEAGAHRLRLEMTAANGDPVTFWLGIDVSTLPLQLPVTGSSESTTTIVALWTLLLGIGLSGLVRCRSRVRRLRSE
jgi:hypothetical protein